MFRLGAIALLLCSLLAPTASAQATAADPQHRDRGVARAEAALDRVTSLISLGDQDGELTLALRDLALRRSALPAGERARAAAYLSRPTANPGRCPDYACYTTKSVRKACTKKICVHYVRKTADATNGVPKADKDGDGTPNYVEKVLATMSRVQSTYVKAGYRRPIGDGTRGGDGRPDVYLAQIGNQGLYGYCTSDAENLPAHSATWAYCVLDNDYAKSEFPAHTPIQNMQVTAAHEYFHAVQFAYDIGEDAWFMEATATWAEDEVFDRVNDNVSYLPIGPMGHPSQSLDTRRGGYWYGAWIFFRSVTEQFPDSQAGLPIIVRTMWRKADAATASAPNLYSMAAVEQALTERGSSTGAQLLRMAADNLHPRRWYAEGERYPGTGVNGTWALGPDRASKRIGVSQDHLTSASYRFAPSHTGARWRLSLTLDLAPTTRGSEALVRVFLKSGKVREAQVELTDAGDYSGTFAFAGGKVKYVELTLANGSVRYNCDVATGWSCHGRPLDQDQVQSVVAEAQRA